LLQAIAALDTNKTQKLPANIALAKNAFNSGDVISALE
jgi:hypothetical protein